MTLPACARCRTELSPSALACPVCATLVHAEQLTELAARAEESSRAGDLTTARATWQRALELLPVQAEQHTVIQNHVATLTRTIDSTHLPGASSDASKKGWWGRAGAVGTVALLLASKLKFLLLGLTKASTFISMFAFFGVYWSIYGWPLALGLVGGIYIHEMGHVAMLRKLGIASGAPLFIPGFGAVVMLKQHVTDPLTDAMIGLAGPLWGFGAAVVALAIYLSTGAKIWLVIGQLTAVLNLFNLIPVWQLDGSRGMHVLARGERWVLVGVMAAAFYLTRQPMLMVIGAVAVWRAWQKDQGPGDTRVLGTYAFLVVALALMAGEVHSVAPPE